MKYKIFLKYFLPSILLFNACAYYNTFFNAEVSYTAGIEKKEQSKADVLSRETINQFEIAISKSWRVIYLYGDSNSWADDALLLIGKSHYQLKEYGKSQEVLSNFLQKYLKSPLKTEAELWLALSLLEQDNTDDAIISLKNIITTTDNSDLLSQANYHLGEIFSESEDYEQAQKYYQDCIDSDGQEIITGKAQYKLADIYFSLKEYEKAKEEYRKVLIYEMPVQIYYDAIVQMTNALLQSENFQEAEETLKNLLNDQRFKDYFSLIEAKLANMVEFQGDIQFAVIKYEEVIEKYPKTEGSALSQFYLAQLYEFEYGQFDSAKVKYDNVSKEFRASEASDEAIQRSKLLKQYLDIRSSLKTDRDALISLEKGDSLIVDSVTVNSGQSEEGSAISSVDPEISKPGLDLENNNNDSELEENDFGNEISSFGNNNTPAEEPKGDEKIESKPVVKKKKERTRNKPEIEKSLLKNSYNLAEYFLLTYVHSDSAQVWYNNFINNFSDSLLTPKAHYALYYIYHRIQNDSIKSEYTKKYILDNYPGSIYSDKLSGKLVATDSDQTNQDIKNDYLKAENYLSKKEYLQAIAAFSHIAKRDSGSIWAKKARYAVCYIYENSLVDNIKAIESYNILAKEYPNSDVGKIAINKIKQPPPEIVEEAVIENENEVKEEKKAEEELLPIEKDLPEKKDVIEMREEMFDNIEKVNIPDLDEKDKDPLRELED